MRSQERTREKGEQRPGQVWARRLFSRGCVDAGSRTYITHTHSTRQGKAQPPQLADRVHFPRVADQWCFFFLLVFFRASPSFLLLSGRASPRSLWAYIRVVQGSSR